MKRILNNSTKGFLNRENSYQRFVNGIFKRCQSQKSKADTTQGDAHKETKDAPKSSVAPKAEQTPYESPIQKYISDEENVSDTKWRIELDWFSKALEPALQLYRRTMSTGNGDQSPPTSRSVSEIIASIQKSRVGIQDWSLSDLTIGLYLIYLRQSSMDPVEDVRGIQVASESTVNDLMYYTELAKGSYKDSAASLARYSMLRENNVLKFVKDSSVMRPGYYIGIDPRRKLVILGIRGTHSVYDLITDMISSSNGDVTYEGYSTHFGTAEAARWFIRHEMTAIRKCLKKYEGFRLRLVGHSLGGATASLLAIMLRRKSADELGFDPGIVSAVTLATPPCVSKELAESCSDYVKTLVMQDDIIPRLSVASLTQLRNEILQTDWMNIIEKEDWKNFMGLVTNARQVMSSVQDVARKLSDYAKFRSKKLSSDTSYDGSSASAVPPSASSSMTVNRSSIVSKKTEASSSMHEELYVPGTIYCLKRNTEMMTGGSNNKGRDYYTLLKRHPGEHFQRIVLSGNLITDHKCDSHYYALRDVLKDLPLSSDEDIFR